ncbi:carboxymuconolactone decarboxylase family protein [Sphingomonas sp. TREG-RG-20F-R18-01]|uniref:carboxymuconolactone decarboxylase family protein n=1 Tax=Sphingomonas sp. TREG-RG-20F-R18-01 TaxID=2914982 RepID=UPI001F5AD172|nr:carboxymuconolactone decarboxylase family protein [Sphingomonas sp. TREG-RG-20F-R18-01]
MTFPTRYAAAVAVPLPDDDVIRPVIEAYYGSAYQPDTTLNVVKMFAGTGAHFAGVIDTVNAIFGPEGIDPKHRQACMMRVAKDCDAPYEWQIHASIGRNVGLSEDEIAAFASDGPVAGVGQDYILLCRACDELTGAKTLTDDTLSELLSTFGEVSTRKYILSISVFVLMALCLNGNRVPLESSDKVSTVTTSNPAGLAVRQSDPRQK